MIVFFVGVLVVQEEYGHGVMLAVFDTVDDTILVSKALISVRKLGHDCLCCLLCWSHDCVAVSL